MDIYHSWAHSGPVFLLCQFRRRQNTPRYHLTLFLNLTQGWNIRFSCKVVASHSAESAISQPRTTNTNPKVGLWVTCLLWYSLQPPEEDPHSPGHALGLSIIFPALNSISAFLPPPASPSPILSQWWLPLNKLCLHPCIPQSPG